LLAELGLRLMGYGLDTDSAFQPDFHCGARHVPNFRGWHTKEGRVWVEINSHGFRDRERTLTKPPNTYRIAVLGDSFAEAFQVQLDKPFWSVMERQLAERWQSHGQRVEVLNFGVSGYGTAQQLEMLRHYVWDYQPDLVLLQFLASNDVCSNSRALEPQDGRPFYTLEDDRLVLDNSFRRDPERVRFQTSTWIKMKHAVVENTRLGALVYQFRHYRQKKQIDEMEAGLTAQAFCEPTNREWQDAWTVTDRLVVEMARRVTSRGAEFAVIMANVGFEVAPDDLVREPILAKLGVSELLYPERRMQTLGATHGFPVVRLAEPMLEYAKKHQTYLHGFSNTRLGTGHWNEAGHRLAGEIAANLLIDLGLGPPALASSEPE
jgi:lysophospholipase L1-like esterase